jgi:hypothetical protein
MAFIRYVQSDFSRKTAYLTCISKAHNLLGCLGCAAEQSMQRRDCNRKKLILPSSHGSLYITTGLRQRGIDHCRP